MKTRVKWIEDMTFFGESNSGHAITLSAGPKYGGRDSGFRPMELLLLGLGGCTSIDVISMLKKARQKVEDCVVEIEAQRADTIPSVFTKIHVHFIVTGQNLKESQVKRAISLSADKYCSASITLAKTAEITHDYEVINSNPE